MLTGQDTFEMSCSIRQLLQAGSVMSANDLARYFKVEQDAVCAALQLLIRSGGMEVLQPVGEHDASSGVYYRWKRDQDRTYFWQHLMWRNRMVPRRLSYLMPDAPA